MAGMTPGQNFKWNRRCLNEFNPVQMNRRSGDTDKRIDNKKTALLLSAAFRKSGMSQSSLSNVIGIKQSQISRLLNGRFQRPSKSIDALCIHLKVTPVARKDAIKLQNYPELALCLELDGSRKKERAVIRILKSAQTFRRHHVEPFFRLGFCR